MGKFARILHSRLFENFISLGFIQGVNYVLPLVTIPFLFNQLGVEKYGLVNFSFAFVQYFIILTDFGFGLSATRFIASNRENKEAVNRYLNSACMSRLLMALVSLALLLICIFCISVLRENMLFTIIFWGQVIGNCMNPVWFFQGMERMKYNTILHITTRVISIVPLFFIIRTPDDYLYISIFYSTGAIIAGFLSLFFIKRYFGMRFFFTSVLEIWEVTCDSSKYFFSRLSVSLFTNTNTFLLGLVCGNVAVGYYSLADKIYMALNSIYGPVNGALFPYMTKQKNLLMFKKILSYGVMFNTALLFCFYWVFPYLYPLIFDDFSKNSLCVLNILMFSNLICLPATFLGYPFLAAWGHPNYCNYTLIASSVFHLCGLTILYLLGAISIYSVAVMVVMCELFLLCLRIYGVKKYCLWK